jgi:hypothetical protein
VSRPFPNPHRKLESHTKKPLASGLLEGSTGVPPSLRFVAAVYDCRIGAPCVHRQPLQSRAAARSCTQGRVGAPSLTHLRGSAAIATRKNAAGAAEKRVKPEVDPKGFALPRGIVAAVYDCRIGGLSGAHRDAAIATAPIPRFYRAAPVRNSFASISSNAVIASRNSARKASA